MTPLYVNKFAVAILIFEDFARRLLKQTLYDLCYLPIFYLPHLPDARLSGKIKLDDVAFNLHVFRS